MASSHDEGPARASPANGCPALRPAPNIPRVPRAAPCWPSAPDFSPNTIETTAATPRLFLPFVLSTMSSRSIEEVAQSAEKVAESPRWFQLYWGKNPELTASMVQRAERAGYSALVVTLDTHSLGWRERDLHHGYLPFMLGQGLSNYFSDPVFRGVLAEPPEQNPMAAIQLWGTLFSNPALTWKDIGFFRQHPRLRIILNA